MSQSDPTDTRLELSDRVAELLTELVDDADSLTRLTACLIRWRDAASAVLLLHRLWQRDGAALGSALADPERCNRLVALASAGPHLSGLLLREPDALAVISSPVQWPGVAELADTDDLPSLQTGLRHLARRQVLQLAADDLTDPHLGTDRDGLLTATEGLSTLAELTLNAALWCCRRQLVARHGECRDGGGQPVPLVMLGMGKLGAGELNYGSDIDLIALYGRGAKDSEGPSPLAPEEFFSRLVRQTARALAEQTADGWVFRVDLRLRPHGNNGPMAASVAGAMGYYETVGDTWERAAYIKARPVAGSDGGDTPEAPRALALGVDFLAELRPFIYRHYLDYPALEAIRAVRARIHARQVARDQVGSDLKLGSGGIREIEFFVQAQQLIHGGHDASLRSPKTLTALTALAAAEHVRAEDAATLAGAYRVLRHLEHRVQLATGEQTHLLPDDPAGRQRLDAQLCGWLERQGQPDVMTAHRWLTGRVQAITGSLFGPPEIADTPFSQLVETLLADPEQALSGEALLPLNLRQPAGAREPLRALARAATDRGWTEAGLHRWRQLLPLFLSDLAGGDDPDRGVAGLARFVAALKGRGIYAAMLAENPDARTLLSKLFASSVFLTAHLARHPALLDELLAAPALLEGRDTATLNADLHECLSGLEEEQWLDGLRRFKHREVLRVALAELLGGLSEQQRGEALARLAQVLIGEVLTRSWHDMTTRYGQPPGDAAALTVVSLGRLGGGEMGYGSDLDLMFMHPPVPPGPTVAARDRIEVGMTPAGITPIDGTEFYARLGRRIVSRMTTATGDGVLYAVDMRLRPSGASGQLVTSLPAFVRYQQQQAQTWEKQALTRARVVASTDHHFANRVTGALTEAAYTPRDPETTRREVAAMRQKMRDHLSTPARLARVDLKQDAGGIVDIEFIVQCLLLMHGYQRPAIRHHNPRKALAALVEAGLLSDADGRTLQESYRLYRTIEGHLQRVEGGDGVQLFEQGDPLPGGRQTCWQQVQAARAQVTAIFERVVGVDSPGSGRQ